MTQPISQPPSRTSSTPSTPSAIERLRDRAKLLMAAFRKTDFQDPTNFSAQLIAIFEQYDEAVVVAVTDPRNPDALQRRYKWPPTLNEVGEACDAERDRQHRMKQEPLRKTPRYRFAGKRPGSRANLRIHKHHPLYPEIYAWTQSFDADPVDWKVQNGGLYIGLHIWERFFRQKLRFGPKTPVIQPAGHVPKDRTERGMATTRAWLDRSDPDARMLSGQEHKADRDRRLAKEARTKLVAEFGQDAFDAVPDQPASFRHLPDRFT
jgi:hypothetical protein